MNSKSMTYLENNQYCNNYNIHVVKYKSDTKLLFNYFTLCIFYGSPCTWNIFIIVRVDSEICQKIINLRQPCSGFRQSSSGFRQPSSGYLQKCSGFRQPCSGFRQSWSGFRQSCSGFQQPCYNLIKNKESHTYFWSIVYCNLWQMFCWWTSLQRYSDGRCRWPCGKRIIE